MFSARQLGDPERLAREERGRAGIPLDAATWEELLSAGPIAD